MDWTSGRLAALTMAWLLRAGPDDRPRPELATEVPSQRNGGISQDGKTIIYHLRHDAVWSDGSPFTARDVTFSTRAVLDPHNNEQNRFFFDDIASIESPDRYTVVLRLKHPYGGAIYDYFFSVGDPPILPAHILQQLPNINTAPYNALPVGIGPFEYVRWDRGRQIVLAANPRYFRGRPKLDRIIVKTLPSILAVYGALRSHEIDLALWYPYLSGGIQKDRQFSTLEEHFFEMNYLVLNLRRPPFNELAVRKAVRLAIDRPRMLQIIYEGNVGLAESLTDSPYPTGHPMYADIPIAPHDTAAANRMLDGAGWRRGPDGVRAKNGRRLEIFIPGQAGFRVIDSVDELLRADLHDIGAVADTRNYAWSYLSSSGGPIARGNFDLTLSNFDLDAYGDISPAFGCGEQPPKGWNKGAYCDHSLDALLAAFNATYEESPRRGIAARIGRKIFEDAPIVNLVAGGAFWVFNTDLVGFKPSRTSFYDNFTNVDI